jgi:hypothetical protein
MTTPLEEQLPGRLRILMISTKPAYPPVDGGRLLMWNTIKALAALGHRVTFVSPDLNLGENESERHLLEYCAAVHLIPARAGRLGPSLIRAFSARLPSSIVRHSHAAVSDRVTEILADQRHDVLHAEQIHSLANLPDTPMLPPVVLRAQNVESQLWRMVARIKPRLAWFARREARQMASFEAGALDRAACTIALTEHDGAILGGALGMTARRIRIIPPPFPSSLERVGRPLDGDPAIVLVAGGWLPNADSTNWFFSCIWKEIRASMPSARVHVFGENAPTTEPGAISHLSPTDSSVIFGSGAILVVPLRIASGIRMKILEAWARGVPVVATPEAARGLHGSDGKEFLLANDAQEFTAAIHRLDREKDFRNEIVANGRSALMAHHQPESVASLLEETYLEVVAREFGLN